MFCFINSGEKLVQWASENLVVEVLIHSQVNTLLQCMKNLLASFTRHRHIIHAGYTFQGSGSWILQVKILVHLLFYYETMCILYKYMHHDDVDRALFILSFFCQFT